MIFYVLAGLAAGICAGLYFPVYIPPEYGKMLSVALMAALDTAFGGIRSSMEGSWYRLVSGWYPDFWDAHFPKSGGDQTSVFEKIKKFL